VATHEQTGAPFAAADGGGVSSLAFDAGAGVLATGNADGTIRLWNAAGFHQTSTPLLIGPAADPPTSGAAARSVPAALSAGGSSLAAVADNGTVQLWAVGTGHELTVPATGSGTGTGTGSRAATALALSPDGKTLAVATAAGDVQLYQAATGQRSGSLLPASGLDVMAFSQDGGTLATASGDGTIRLWDTATQRQEGRPLTATAGPAPAALAFSQDGGTLATASSDGTIRLWDTATQQETGPPMTAGPDPVYALAFSPDGGTLAAYGGDGAVRQWNVALPGNLLSSACAIAGQSLSRQQWAAYAGSQPFRQVCPAS
jgi:hypothetical protein